MKIKICKHKKKIKKKIVNKLKKQKLKRQKIDFFKN